MAIFSQLITENAVQIGERIRFDGRKSFVTRGSDNISTMTVTPENDITPIDVFNDDVDERFLDWVFNDFEIDINSSNNKIDFQESGGVAVVATLTSATYTLSALATEIKTQMDAAGGFTYTVTYDVEDKITIAATGSFVLLVQTGINRNNSLSTIIGFRKEFDTDITSSLKGARTEFLTRAVTVTIGDGTLTSTQVKNIKVFSEDGDKLFSNDNDLIAQQFDIMRWLPIEKSTFNFKHRRAQDLIMSWLDEKGYVNVFGQKFLKKDVFDIDEFRQWSTFMVLKLIFEGNHNAVDDIHKDKAGVYSANEIAAKARTVLRIDIDRDGKVDVFEDINSSTGRIFRR